MALQYVCLQRAIHAAISYTAEEKYQDFVARFPGLAGRVPLKMLASYLGITPESLSRVRKLGMGTALFSKMEAFKMDPQTIADGVLSLVQMKAGSRPLRYPLDAVAEGTDLEFINARAEIKKRWLAKHA